MPDPLSYRTLAAPSEGIYREKGSKFLAFAYPVKDEAEIRQILDDLRKRYHDARHHCYAWQTGTGPVEQRAHDDGEPAHSAGQPILGQIQAFGLTRVLVVVIRYFGGVLLGVGGLVRAYKTAARNALEQATVVEVQLEDSYRIRFRYDELNLVMRVLHEESARILSQEYGDACQISFAIARKTREHCLERIGNIPSPDIDIENIDNETSRSG